jgi:peptidoglycan/LPS O-acetylase OafA/YrhL
MKPSLNPVFERRENNLDAVRLILAVLVILSHSWFIGLGNDGLPAEPMMRATQMQTSFGNIAVDLFFAISGFLIANSFLNSRSIWSYLKKRVARIYPGFVVCMLFCALVVVPLSGAHFTQNGIARQVLDFIFRTLWLHEFRYANAFPGNLTHAINGSMWTIANEFYCYLFLAAVGVAGILRRRGLVLGLFLAWLIGFEAMLVFNPLYRLISHVSADLPGHLPLVLMFLAGMVFFLYRKEIPHKTSIAIACVVALAISARIQNAWHLVFALAGTYLVFWFGFHPRVRWHKITRHGDFSYGVYLYAYPIQDLVTQRLGGQANPLLLFSIATPITLVAAVVSWHAVEKWFLSSNRRHRLEAPSLPEPQAQLRVVDEEC